MSTSQHTPHTLHQHAIPYIFFGSATLSVHVLNTLAEKKLLPAAIITTPDKPRGRNLILTPNDVKTWALKAGIPVYTPEKLNEDFIKELETITTNTKSNVYVVAAYGKIIPAKILDIPKRHILNIHPSLLPQYRGASPLPTAILEDTKKTGITIMRIDAEMDHGPIVAQEAVDIASEWPTYEVFEKMMAERGALLLANILPQWVDGTIQEIPQDHTKATYTRKITKEDGLVDLADIMHLSRLSKEAQYTLFRKIQAYHEWPTTYFFIEKRSQKIRVKITKATWSEKAVDGKHLSIERVIPEGKNEMDFSKLALQ